MTSKISLLLVSCFLFLLIGCAGIEPSPSPKTTDRAPPSSLQKIWEDPEQLFQEAKRSYKESNYPVALTALERILTTFPKSEVYADAKKLSEEIQNRLGSADFKIGVILPLSGSFARFGESALDGVGCAIGLFEPCGGALSNIQIVVKDTKGSPGASSQAVRELVEKEGVAAIIGPLTSAEINSATQEAQNLMVPMIVLAPQEGATQAGNYIFQHSLSSEMEISNLAEKAFKFGLKKFVIFYPQNKYGQQYRDLFVNELGKRGGGRIIAQTGYTPELPDFLGILEPLKEKLSTERLGIFIPDSYKQVAAIAQTLDMMAIHGPKLIGTSRAHHPHLLINAAAALEGALVDTSFFPEANRETTQSFSSSFQRAFGNSPAWLEAFAYDATRLVLQAFTARGASRPQAIQEGLVNIQNFPSVSGTLSWDDKRRSQWPLDFITVRDGQFSPLN
ncbi:MAG: hypothetical protein A2W61_07515 [Deltaproteobacteria bacterium RIFCSPLOWO2_01_44_7]|nr:MAG: hypothetical protein A2712_08635 [Deltaproteobacteria bacterium RIFCSPHIGHO2_01_FULL_43_49]OGQ14596.1 MAG: hypothetical protein A3D22_08365 [Deltaproteobacteria bacterium RIFCSPHIGHO2_02_FULL_44_53]OGQ27982.1 MAG: hypothetical protein A3D98_07075 [Deltaproteobacteria bacterium RIFCSPHIGHO2_12_FULL_44_21]OGQ31194.1 MAG: hypothetical protein A2979_07125 [Deltaproteobacteria bacterium RIFCSPLOWO2_01_FULL_45_74]OGQ37978.1 MAG: hypothetical protein A2W61_07515 [Deltaproteobacteria bacterium 